MYYINNYLLAKYNLGLPIFNFKLDWQAFFYKIKFFLDQKEKFYSLTRMKTSINKNDNYKKRYKKSQTHSFTVFDSRTCKVSYRQDVKYSLSQPSKEHFIDELYDHLYLVSPQNIFLCILFNSQENHVSYQNFRRIQK